MFVPKVIWSNGLGTYPVIDSKGEWGLTQFSYAIVDTVRNLNYIKTAMNNPSFIKLMGYVKFQNHKYDYRVISFLKKDFWKDFLSTKVTEESKILHKSSPPKTQSKKKRKKKKLTIVPKSSVKSPSPKIKILTKKKKLKLVQKSSDGSSSSKKQKPSVLRSSSGMGRRHTTKQKKYNRYKTIKHQTR